MQHFPLLLFPSCLLIAPSHTLAIVVAPTRGNPAKGVLLQIISGSDVTGLLTERFTVQA